jgi:hypothetical protein
MTRGREVRRQLALAALLAAPLLFVYATIEPTTAPASSSATAAHVLAKPIASRTDAALPAEPGPSPAPAFEFVKPDEVAIAGTVVAPDGAPVRGANILVQLDVTMPMPRTVRACTGPDGRFRVAAPPKRPVHLIVVTPTSPPHGFRYPVARVRIEAGGTNDLIVRLWTGESITGRVVDAADNAVSGLRLRTQVPKAMSAGDYVAAETTTATDGSFAFDGLPPGFATIVEDWPSGAVMDHALLDVADLRTGTRDLRVQRLATRYITGRVTDPSGKRHAYGVILRRKGGALVVETRVLQDGSFHANVAAPGTYVVRVRCVTANAVLSEHDVGEIDAASTAEKTLVVPSDN